MRIQRYLIVLIFVLCMIFSYHEGISQTSSDVGDRAPRPAWVLEQMVRINKAGNKSISAGEREILQVVVDDFRVNEHAARTFHVDPFTAMGSDGSFVVVWGEARNPETSNDVYAQRYNSDGTPSGLNFRVNDDEQQIGQFEPSVAMDGNGHFVVVWYDMRNGNFDIYGQRFTSSGVRQGDNFKVNDDDGSTEQRRPVAGMSASGSFTVVWEDKRDGGYTIYGQRYNAGGEPQGSNFVVNDDGVGGWDIDPAIGMDFDGDFVIAWQDNRTLGGGIYCQRYDSNGDPQGANFRANEVTGTGGRYNPVAAMDNSGNFIIAWDDYRNSQFDIYAQRYNGNGLPLSGNFRVNDDGENASQRDPAVAMNGNGDCIVAWYDERHGNLDVYFQRYNSTGAAVGSNVLANDDGGTRDQRDANVAIDGSGNVIVVWNDARHGQTDIFGQRYNSNGFTQGINFRINDDEFSSEERWPAVAVDGSGHFGVVWTDSRNGNSDIYGQRYSSTGAPLGSNFMINDDALEKSQTTPDVAIDDAGNFVVMWIDRRNGSDDIYGQRYNSSGAVIGSNFRVNDQGGSVGSSGNPDIGMNGDGRFVVVWIDERNNWQDDVYAQIYAANGTPLGSNFKVNDDIGSHDQERPSAAMDGNGNFVLVWTDERNGNEDVYGQRFDVNGTTQGGNFRVNDDADDSRQRYSSTGIDETGSAVVAWWDERDGKWDIYGQRYNNAGLPVGSNFCVTDDGGESAKGSPSIDVSGNGSFVVAWGDHRNGDYDIYAQRYDENGSVVGGNFQINTYTGTKDQRNQDIGTAGQVLITTWEDARMPDRNWDIYANVIDLSEVPLGTVDMPTFSPDPGMYATTQNVSMTCATDGATIRYTTDGSDPTETSAAYTGTIQVASTTTIKARGYLENWTPSDLASGTYTITPVSRAPIYPLTATPQKASDEFWVDIYVGNESETVSDLFGVSFKLNYTQTDFIDVVIPYSANVVPDGFLGSDVVFFQTVEDTAGKVSIGNSRKTGQGGVDGYGVVARVKFITDGNTPDETQIQFSISNVSAIDVNGSSMILDPGSQTVTIGGGLEVWPGDTNNDGIVNQADILPIGFYWNSTGPARPYGSITWTGQRCPTWTPEAATYADASGDGKVDQADILPIGLNWSKTHDVGTFLAMSKGGSQTMNQSSSSSLGLVIDGQPRPDQAFWVDVHAEGVEDLFGLAFDLVVSPSSKVEILSVVNDEWLGEDVVFYSKEDTAIGEISVGISRKMGQGGVTGSGCVARLKMRMSEGVTTGNSIDFSFQNIVANDPHGNPLVLSTNDLSIESGVGGEVTSMIPTRFTLGQNYPNPFNPSTTIPYGIPKSAHMQRVRLEVYNALGEKISTLVDEVHGPGLYSVRWDCRNEVGSPVSGGMYLYRLQVGSFVEVRKMLLIR